MRRFKRFVLPAVFCYWARQLVQAEGIRHRSFWDMSRDGDPAPTRFEFSGTESAGTVLETGALPPTKITPTPLSASRSHQIPLFPRHRWSRSTYTGVIDEKEERMDGTYAAKAAARRAIPFRIIPGPGRR